MLKTMKFDDITLFHLESIPFTTLKYFKVLKSLLFHLSNRGYSYNLYINFSPKKKFFKIFNN